MVRLRPETWPIDQALPAAKEFFLRRHGALEKSRHARP
jgi:hypothetical protein